MYVVWFHAERESYRNVWGVSFIVVAFALTLIGAIWREEGRLPNSDWKQALMLWIGANFGGLVIVSIFWFYGN
jgi:hypothetical protein